MADLLDSGSFQRAVASGFSFRYPELQGAIDHLIGTSAEGHDAAPAEMHYNGECPVSRAEISHYAKVCADASISVQFIDATKQEGSLAACGLRREHLRRRLSLRDTKGRLLNGMPTPIELRYRMPGCRWLSVLLSAPLVRQLSSITYDQVIAPTLVFWARRRAR